MPSGIVVSGGRGVVVSGCGGVSGGGGVVMMVSDGQAELSP